MRGTPKSFRLHIGIFGRRNVGKSSLLNSLTRQNVSIVSDVAGTTTDPVEKPMELLPIGPVLFIDTAGIDDAGALGELRVQRTRQVFDRTDLGLIVTEAATWGTFEEGILAELAARKTPVVVVFNKTDLAGPDPKAVAELEVAENPVGRDGRLRGERHPGPARGADPRRAGGFHQRALDPRRPGPARRTGGAGRAD